MLTLQIAPHGFPDDSPAYTVRLQLGANSGGAVEQLVFADEIELSNGTSVGLDEAWHDAGLTDVTNSIGASWTAGGRRIGGWSPTTPPTASRATTCGSCGSSGWSRGCSGSTRSQRTSSASRRCDSRRPWPHAGTSSTTSPPAATRRGGDSPARFTTTRFSS